MAQSRKKGRQTPTQSLILPYNTTYGAQAVELYNSTGRNAQEWQELLLYDILAVNEEGLWTHTKFGYSVPRRNGKNEIVAMRELYGLEKGEHILHTAHRTTTSHAAWERLCGLLEAAGIKYKSIRASGRESVRLKDGGRVEFRTRSTKGGLGEGFDLLVIDEAQEYTIDQESALKYVVTDSKNPQTVFCGTPPTPISSGTVFTKLRRAALAGTTENTGWAEWSVPHRTDPNDREAWYQANPSLGTVFTERSVADEVGTDEVDFNIQRLGLWLKYNQKSAVGQGEWLGLKCEALPKLKGKLFVGIKYGKDRVALSLAVRTTDDKIFVEGYDCQPIRSGNNWILGFLAKADVSAVIVDGAGSQELLAESMKQARMKPPLLPTVKQVITANASFEQSLYTRDLCHMAQPSMVQVVTNCEKRAIGSGGGFGYRAILEGAAIELMDSMILASWQCREFKEPKKQRISY